ncbi:methyltransferase [Plasmodium brasilianum]|uniref:Methyltransferase n=1 Tax=Plasmodium brasilianum TaxID=5824 RepID=A0ACB9Y4G5_PLABR|nr:methyltransferase [Plasmodium brasilianum]
MLILIGTKKNHNNYLKCRYFSKVKYIKNTKFKEELYKYHHEQYIDDVSIRPILYLKEEIKKEKDKDEHKYNHEYKYSGVDKYKEKEKNMHDRRLKRNVPLVYSNEVSNLEELKNNPFTLVNVKNNNGESFGIATFNPYSLITARIISQNTLFPININFFIEKIKACLLWRSKLTKGGKNRNMISLSELSSDDNPSSSASTGMPMYSSTSATTEMLKCSSSSTHTSASTGMSMYSSTSATTEMLKCSSSNTHTSASSNVSTSAHTNTSSMLSSDISPSAHVHAHPMLDNQFCYRLINSEGDNLPGLIIDRFDEYISVQHLTVGCEMLACNINDALIELLKPKGIIFRNDNKERLNEKLEIYKKVVYGKIPEQVILIENDCFFLIDLINSPGTGWFFNRKCLRNLLCTYAYQKNILDLFSYVGSFGIQCAKNGKAKSVKCVEKDKKFVQLAKNAAYLNNIKNNNIEFICCDYLQFFKNCNELFDIIVLDPPNLIPKSKFIESGKKRYIDLINVAQKYITSNGLLLIIFTTKLCSYHDYINIINESFVGTNRSVKIVGQGRASPDNPVHISLYLFADFYWFILQISF